MRLTPCHRGDRRPGCDQAALLHIRTAQVYLLLERFTEYILRDVQCQLSVGTKTARVCVRLAWIASSEPIQHLGYYDITIGIQPGVSRFD